MLYKIAFDTRAVTELANVITWYEDQSSATAEKFQTAFALAIDVLSKGMIDYVAFREEIKKAPVPDFPYLIYYSRQEESKTVFIHAMLHIRRNADFISDRLSE